VSGHYFRKEKNCLNCGAEVSEKYCPHCGQANKEPTETFFQLTSEFFSDITHFDSKVFTTLKDLIVRPGFLTKEYNAGRRVRYLNPIRLYVFISAIFFLLLFSSRQDARFNEKDEGQLTGIFRQQFADSLRSVSDTMRQSSVADTIRKNIYRQIASRLDSPKNKAADEESVGLFVGDEGRLVIEIEENKYRSTRHYDSVQQQLPDSLRDKCFLKWLLRNNARLKSEHQNRNHIRIVVDMQHSIPKIMFVLLPLFALLIGLFYNREKYFYVQHAIFSIHFHAFVFLSFILALLLDLILPGDWTGLILWSAAYLFAFIYLAIALGKAYQQSLFLSTLKTVAIICVYSLLILVTLCLLVFITFWFE
jgi:hypothetical protein